MSNGSASIVQPNTTSSAAKQPAARTRLLLEGPIVSTLLRLAAPNLVVNVVLIAVTATVVRISSVRWDRVPWPASHSFSR
jgi:hypothetical protein